MGFLEAILAKVGASLVEWLWGKLQVKLDDYFEKKSKINSISTEAQGLQEELKNASSDAERIEILRKIGSFSERLGS